MRRAWLSIAVPASLAFSGVAQAADQPSMALDLFKVLFGLVVVLGAMAAVLWLLIFPWAYAHVPLDSVGFAG